MGQVVTATQQILEDSLPGEIGTNRRWDATSLERLIMIADRIVRERLEDYLASGTTVTLVAGTATYALPTTLIDVHEVLLYEGTEEYWLKRATFEELDSWSTSWRYDGGVRPEYYVLTGAPGNPGATVTFHPKPAGAAPGTVVLSGPSIGTATTTHSDTVISEAVAPLVLSMMLAKEDPDLAHMWLGRYQQAVTRLRAGVVSPNVMPPARGRIGW